MMTKPDLDICQSHHTWEDDCEYCDQEAQAAQAYLEQQSDEQKIKLNALAQDGVDTSAILVAERLDLLLSGIMNTKSRIRYEIDFVEHIAPMLDQMAEQVRKHKLSQNGSFTLPRNLRG